MRSKDTIPTFRTHRQQPYNDERITRLRKETDRTLQSQRYSNLLSNSSITHSRLAKFGTRFSFFSVFQSVTAENVKASLSIEAAIVLPLFLFMMFILLYPMKIIEAERKLQNQMENVGKNLAKVEYIQSVGTKFLKDGSNYSEFITNAVDGLETGTALGIILAEASSGPFQNLHYSTDTAVFSKEEGANADMFYAELQYEPVFPFSAYRIAPIEKSLVVNRRAWVGSAGGRGRSKYAPELDDGEEEDRIVYLGKNSTVYHDSPNCHYLSNVMHTSSVSGMEELRNSNGERYHSCPSCKPGNSGTVYYFESGTAYHSSEQCKAITAYAHTAKYSEVSGMRACSYCGKGH